MSSNAIISGFIDSNAPESKTIESGADSGFSGTRYEVRTEHATPRLWHEWLDKFEDANLYQSGAYGSVRWGASRLSHIFLATNEGPLAMAQLRIMGFKSFRAGIAYLRWGPLFHRKGAPPDPWVLARMADALRDEYVRKRGLYLRILPHAMSGTARGALFTEAFKNFRTDGPEVRRTFILDLAPPLEQLRRDLDQKWRNQLNRAEKNNLTVVEGVGADEFNMFRSLYGEMMGRKQFQSDTRIEEFVQLQDCLPLHHKMRILICKQEGVPVAGIVCTAMGDTGIYIHGATGDAGLKAKGAYLLQWKMLTWLKEQGYRYYDLGGINREKNPGVYHFKAGFSADEHASVPPLSACQNRLSTLMAKVAFMAKEKSFLSALRRSSK